MTTLVITAMICLLGSFIVPIVMSQLANKLAELSAYSLSVDSWIESATSSTVMTDISNVFTNIGISLLSVLFILKGYQTYMLYTDGDAESDPIGMMTLYIKGLVVAICGNTVLGWFIDIVTDLTTTALKKVNQALGTDYQWDGLVDYFTSNFSETSLSTLLFSFIAVVIFCIFFWIIYFKCMKTGLQFAILKIAMPICAIGLINSDKGIFKSYVMSLSKAMVTIMIQVILTQLGFSILMACYRYDNLDIGTFIGIICLAAASSTPSLLQEFLVPSQSGGNMMMKAYYTSNMVKSITRLVRRR